MTPRLFIPFLSLLARARYVTFLRIPAFRETHHVSLDFFAPKQQKTTFIRVEDSFRLASNSPRSAYRDWKTANRRATTLEKRAQDFHTR